MIVTVRAPYSNMETPARGSTVEACIVCNDASHDGKFDKNFIHVLTHGLTAHVPVEVMQ